MNLNGIIAENYDIPPIVRLSATENGSGNTYLISTDTKKYIAKINERTDFLSIYAKSYQVLICNDLQMSAIIKTKNGDLSTDDGVALYEFIEGTSLLAMDLPQMKSAIHYVHRFNEILRTVSFSPDEIENKTVWDFAKSIDFLAGKFMNEYLSLFSGEGKTELITAIHILITNREKLEAQPCQLIHSDLGSDNFIFCNNQVLSIIDFTPEYANEWYSLCQFLYWNLFWQKNHVIWMDIEQFLCMYNCGYEKDIILLFLIKAAVYRLSAPIADAINNNRTDSIYLEKRIEILKNILILQTE